MRLPITLLILVSLVGCGESRPPPSKLTSEQRSRIDTQRAHESPGMIIQKIDGGEMVVFTVPTGGTEKRLDVQRCFLWRDSYYRTTSMSCPADQSGTEDSIQKSVADSGQVAKRAVLSGAATPQFVPYNGEVIPLKSTRSDDGPSQRP